MQERDALTSHSGTPAGPVRPGEAWSKSKGSARAIRYISLLYTCFFFIEPYYRHSESYWLWFGAFYVVFLTLYFAIPETKGRVQAFLFALLFLLSYVYFPFNESASGAFVYPIVMLAFVMRSTRNYLSLLAATVAGIALETWVLHLHWWAGASGVFFCVVIGLSNLSYSRQQRASYMLQRANEEIEHLAQIAERERIARDLHDLLGHTLTVIAIKSELANRLLLHDPQRAQQEMLDVEQTARKALAEVREAVVGYRSEGLPAEVSSANRALLAAGVKLTTSIAEMPLSSAETNVLCLCLRESVTNIVRHAHAATCAVELLHTDKGIRLIVEDDGEGSLCREGNGLRGMRERIEGLDGRMRIASELSTGTRLVIDLPRKKQSPAVMRPALEMQA